MKINLHVNKNTRIITEGIKKISRRKVQLNGQKVINNNSLKPKSNLMKIKKLKIIKSHNRREKEKKIKRKINNNNAHLVLAVITIKGLINKKRANNNTIKTINTKRTTKRAKIIRMKTKVTKLKEESSSRMLKVKNQKSTKLRVLLEEDVFIYNTKTLSLVIIIFRK